MPDQLTDAVILGGNRIPFGKSGGAYATASNQAMLTAALDGLVARFGIAGERVGEVAAGAPCRPGDGAGPAGVGIGEGLGSQVFTVGGEHGVGVGLGVGVYTDDERMSMRDYGAHSVRFLSSQGR